MPAEVLRSGARLNQPGSIAALNLFESRAKRDALIDSVVSFGTAVPKSTTSEIPVFRSKVLKAPVALDYTTGVINTTPSTPEDPRKDLSHDPVKKRRLSPWRKGLIAATAVVSGLTLAGAASPSPTEAGGNMKLVTASSEGINCVEDKSLLVIDFKYAAELVKGMASGEIVIAVGPVPIAALEEGDKTAVVEPITITPEEVWQKLVKVVPKCPPVVDPTPEPTPMAELIKVDQFKNDLENALKQEPDPSITPAEEFENISEQIISFFDSNPTALTYYQQNIGNNPKDQLDECANGREGETKKDKLTTREQACTYVIEGLSIAYGATKSPIAYNSLIGFAQYLSHETYFPKKRVNIILKNLSRVYTNVYNYFNK